MQPAAGGLPFPPPFPFRWSRARPCPALPRRQPRRRRDPLVPSPGLMLCHATCPMHARHAAPRAPRACSMCWVFATLPACNTRGAAPVASTIPPCYLGSHPSSVHPAPCTLRRPPHTPSRTPPRPRTRRVRGPRTPAPAEPRAAGGAPSALPATAGRLSPPGPGAYPFMGATHAHGTHANQAAPPKKRQEPPGIAPRPSRTPKPPNFPLPAARCASVCPL